MRRAALALVLVAVVASCVRAVAPIAPPRPDARAVATLDGGRDAGTPTCLRPPPNALCDWPPECNRFSERLNGPNGTGFWSGFSTVCSCTKPKETTVTAELIVRELGKDWTIVIAECPGHYEPTSFLRETTVFAMPFLADRPSRVRPMLAYFDPYIAALSDDRKSGNYTFAIHQRAVLSSLRGARWVRFANAMPDGGPTEVTDYVVGFLPSGHLAGFYTDAERW